MSAAVLFVGLVLPSAALPDGAARVQIIDLNDSPVSGAVVVVSGDYDSTLPPRNAVVDQIDKAFVPRVAAVQAGGQVEFPNSDSVGHQVYSFSSPNDFELPLYRDELRPAVTFDHAGLVVLGCNIHDSMLGYIMVVDTPHFAVTDGDGVAALTGLNARVAAQSLQVWSPELGQDVPMTASLVSSGTDTEPARFRIAVVAAAPVDAGGGGLAWDDY